MPLRSVIDLEINDEPFKDFVALFDRYRDTLKQTPGDWSRASAAVDPLAAQFGDLAAAAMADKGMGADKDIRGLFVRRFLVRLDQMTLRGSVERIGSGNGVRWQLRLG